MRLAINTFETIKVFANEPWNKTNIEVSNGEEYSFESFGFWKDWRSELDTNGYDPVHLKPFRFLKRCYEGNWFALIGSISKSKGFFIGKQRNITVKQDGILYLYANDSVGFYWNNSGCISVTITRLK